MKLSKTQQTAWDRIQNRAIESPKTARGDFSPPEDITIVWHDMKGSPSHTWYANRVYGVFNTLTLKALERRGLIKVHAFGGAYFSDTIEVL